MARFFLALVYAGGAAVTAQPGYFGDRNPVTQSFKCDAVSA
jgi:hypothetical protein